MTKFKDRPGIIAGLEVIPLAERRVYLAALESYGDLETPYDHDPGSASATKSIDLAKRAVVSGLVKSPQDARTREQIIREATEARFGKQTSYVDLQRLMGSMVSELFPKKGRRN